MASGGVLTPYVPRLALEWELDAGGGRWRALEGSLIFLDISGFTKMSERLARFGKLGAEEVTETLNATFVRMLDVAYGQGGSLLKFGGDALLLWFAGEEHAARAAATAFDLRAELRSLGRIRTTAGFVQLRMSVGVHTGVFHFFLVGSSHRELLVTGPGVTSTVAMEHDASAGEIVVSAAVADALDARCVGAAKGPGFLLRSRPAAEPPGVAPRREDGADAAAFVSTALRDHISLGGQDAEHRQVAVAFVHYDGTDTRIDAGDLDGVAADLDAFVRVCQTAADELGLGFIGSDVDADGGKVILVAGAPRAIDLQEEAILRASRRILDERPDGLDVRIGVHRGAVFSGDVGTPYRRTYTIMGDAVNTAARVMSRAAAGELLATPDVLDRSPAQFAEEPLEPFAVKGKAKPLQASRVGALQEARTSGASSVLPIVGRDRELDALETVLAGIRGASGGGRIVEVVAEAGMGKTRLLEELRARTEGLAWLTTTCEQYERSTPYYAARAVLRAVLGVRPEMDEGEAAARVRAHVRAVAPQLEPWIALLGVPLDLDLPSSPEVDRLDANQRRARINAVAAEVIAATVRGPAVWVIDDAHWVDEATVSLLAGVAGGIAERPWVVVLARWPGPAVLTTGMADEVTLGPLATEDSLELARAAAGGAMLPQDALLVADRAGGSPLFVQELARALTAKGSGDEVVPETVESLIATRVDALTPRDRELLQTAAVLGRRGDRALLERVAAERQVAVRSLPGFLTVDGATFQFEHGLVREVAYERLPYRRRRLLHLQAAEAALSGGDLVEPEVLSLHFHQGGDTGRAWRYSVTAAERAQRKQAFVDAVTFWRRALEAARRVPDLGTEELVDAWVSLGDALMRSGRIEDAPTAYAAARRLVSEPDALARLCLLEGEARRSLGQPVPALRWYRRGLRLLEGVPGGGDAKHRVRLRLGCAFIDYHRGEYAESMRAAAAAREEAAAAGDLGGLGHSCNLLLLAGTAVGDPATWEYGQQALAAFTEAGIAVLQGEVLCNLGELARVAGRWDEATTLYERAHALLTEAGNVVDTAVVEHNLAEILSDQGRLDEARRLMESALATFRGARHQYVPFAQSQLGRLVARAGDFSAAAEILGEAGEQLRALGIAGEVARVEAFDAERLLFAGACEEAATRAAQILESAPAPIRPLVHRIQGCALAELGRAAEARVALLEGLRLATATGDTFERALLLGALAWTAGEEGHVAEAEAYAAEAASVFEALGVAVPVIRRSATAAAIA